MNTIRGKNLETAPSFSHANRSDGVKLRQATLIVAVGAELTRYEVDLGSATLVKRSSVTLPAAVQYVCFHTKAPYLYTVCSNRGPDGGADPADILSGAIPVVHTLNVVRIDPISGLLRHHGEKVALPYRPIHITLDRTSEHALVAYSEPSHVSVHEIHVDGTVGTEVRQRPDLDTGIFPHQIRICPMNHLAILVTRGFDETNEQPEQPGALKVFNYHKGVLSGEVSIAPNGGYGFGPRHLDFHPHRPWVYVSLERQHQICAFKLDDGSLSNLPFSSTSTLAEPAFIRPDQMTGTIHAHPNGRFIYAAERTNASDGPDGRRLFCGGENTILVYAIDEESGAPGLIQRINTRGIHPRTFSIDPSGSILVAANKSPVMIKVGAHLKTLPASLDVFNILEDGTLFFVRKYDINVGKAAIFWSGFANSW